jgi:hypothetical protein
VDWSCVNQFTSIKDGLDQKFLPIGGTLMISTDSVNINVDLEIAHQVVSNGFSGEKPFFMSRIGGSDTELVADYNLLPKSMAADEVCAALAYRINMLKAYNGYYDRANDPKNIVKFCELFLSGYASESDTMMCNPKLLTMYMPSTINQAFQVDIVNEQDKYARLIDQSAKFPNKLFHPYSYVENILFGRHSLLRTMSAVLPGKKVLVVSPFSESIQSNFHRRADWFPNFQYPEFSLLTYNTPITYSNLPDEFYPDDNWFETLARITADVTKIDFDIALLACGSYAMPLGLYIRDVLGKKAIYVGGCLQLMFGVTGRRYENPYFLDQINREAFILPIEGEKYLKHIRITPEMAREAFGAYF